MVGCRRDRQLLYCRVSTLEIGEDAYGKICEVDGAIHCVNTHWKDGKLQGNT